MPKKHEKTFATVQKKCYIRGYDVITMYIGIEK